MDDGCVDAFSLSIAPRNDPNLPKALFVGDVDLIENKLIDLLLEETFSLSSKSSRDGIRCKS